jgi:acetyl esterase/lipase
VTSEARRRTQRPNLLIRSLLTSVAFLLLAIPVLVVAGGYTRFLPIAGYGRLFNTDLPWLAAGALAALVLAAAALLLGGRRFTAILCATAVVTVMACVVVGAQFSALAGAHGATYDPFRQARAPEPVTRRPSQTLVFAQIDGAPLRADIWRPAAPTGAGVLFIHGGAFTHGGLGLRPRVFGLFSDAGATVADVEYRLAPPPRWQDARADVLCALGWFQRNAASFGVDPERIIVMGESAGGNLALVASYASAYDGGRGIVEPSCDVDPAPPAGVIAVGPTADLAATWEDAVALGDTAPFPAVYTGGTPSEVSDRYRDASVAGLIGPAVRVPTLLLTGVNDGLVRQNRMRDLAAQLQSAGVDVDLIEVPFADHAFDGPANGFGMQLEEAVLPAFLDKATSGR